MSTEQTKPRAASTDTESEDRLRRAVEDKGWTLTKVTYDRTAGWTLEISGEGYSPRMLVSTSVDAALSELELVEPRR